MGEEFARRSRLLKRPEFERVYETGRRQGGKYMTVFVLASSLGRPRLGVAATKKVGSAVQRNRLKRRAREIFRRLPAVGCHDVVIVPRREMLDASFVSLENEYVHLVKRGTDGARWPERRNGGNHPPRTSSL